MYKKEWCTCKIVVLLIKPTAFVAFPLPSPSSDLKVPNFSWDGGNTHEKLKAKVMKNLGAGAQMRCIIGNVEVAYSSWSHLPCDPRGSHARCKFRQNYKLALAHGLCNAPFSMTYQVLFLTNESAKKAEINILTARDTKGPGYYAGCTMGSHIGVI